MKTLKWTADAASRQVDGGKFPHDAEATETALFGDVEKGFAEADLIVERDMHQQTTSHQPLESRSAMAYWQNGKLLPARLDAERRAHGRIGRGLGRHQAR